jgi:hypothetical protein
MDRASSEGLFAAVDDISEDLLQGLDDIGEVLAEPRPDEEVSVASAGARKTCPRSRVYTLTRSLNT